MVDTIEILDAFSVEACGVISLPLLESGEAALSAAGAVGVALAFEIELRNRLNQSTFAAALGHTNASCNRFNSASAAERCACALA